MAREAIDPRNLWQLGILTGDTPRDERRDDEEEEIGGGDGGESEWMWD